MGLFDRIRRGITLLIDSVHLMRNNPRLLLFPAIAGAAGLAFLAGFLGMTFGAMAIRPEGTVLAGLLLAYLGMTFISTFFTAALVHETRTAIVGGDVSVRSGIAGAWGVKGRLLVWSLIAATVGMVLNGMGNSDTRGGRGLGVVFSIAWTLLTFFIVPVIVFERTSLRGMFTRSGETFKRTWGETPIGLGGVQLVAMAVAIPFLLVGYLAFSVQAVVGIGLIVAGAALAFLLAQTLEGVIKTALYLYATEGTTPGEFDNVDFDGLARDDAPGGGMDAVVG